MGHGRRTLAVLASACLLASSAGCGNGSKGSSGSGGEQNFVGGTGAVSLTPAAERGAPVDLRGPRLGGGEFDLAAHRGKVVLINIWGSWCAPCRGEAPALQEAWKELEPRGVQFLGLNTKDDAEAAALAFERNFGITYPSVSDPNGELQLVFRKTLPPTAIPSTIVLDTQGRVAARIVGAGTYNKFKDVVGAVLDETASPSTSPTPSAS
jgi:thiol-disulfide isomerase/thioredoxin